MLNFEIRALVKCSDEERLSCLALIDKIVELAKTARQHGLLVLEETVPELEPYLLQTGIRMIVDACHPEEVVETMDTLIVYSHKKGVELLRQMIISSGVLAIQGGDHPMLIREKLLAYLGEDIAADALRQVVGAENDNPDNDVADTGASTNTETDRVDKLRFLSCPPVHNSSY